MSTIYENVYIGAFILALGYRMGRDIPDAYPLASVNLYQQTQGDSLLGDLFADLSGLSVIIEFKRDWDQVKLERKKPKAVSLTTRLRESSLFEVSRSCHFLAYAYRTASSQVTFNICPYIAIADIPSGNPAPTNVLELDEFLHRILSGNVGVSTEQFRDYINVLSGNGGGLACLLVNFDHNYGVRLFVVEEIRLLQKTRQRIQETLKQTEPEKIKRREPPEEERFRIRQ